MCVCVITEVPAPFLMIPFCVCVCVCVCADPQEKADLGELNFSLCYLPTAGRLTATVIKATNLKAMDLTGFSGKGLTHTHTCIPISVRTLTHCIPEPLILKGQFTPKSRIRILTLTCRAIYQSGSEVFNRGCRGVVKCLVD